MFINEGFSPFLISPPHPPPALEADFFHGKAVAFRPVSETSYPQSDRSPGANMIIGLSKQPCSYFPLIVSPEASPRIFSLEPALREDKFHMPGNQSSSTSRIPLRRPLGLAPSVPVDELDEDMEDFSPPSTSISLTSSLLALSPIRNLSAELREAGVLPPVPRSPSPPRPSVEIAPLPLSCPNCGAPTVTAHPSTVALYLLSVTMPSEIHSGVQVQGASQPLPKATKATSTLDPALNTSSGRGKKRKAATNEVSDESAFSSLAPPAKIAKKRAAAASSTTRISQAACPSKKVTFAPAVITPKTAISARTFADSLLPFSDEDDADDGEVEQELLTTVSQTTSPAPTMSQGEPGPSTSGSSSLQEKRAELAELLEEKRRLMKYKVWWEREQAAMQVQNNDIPAEDELIPRPPGEKGKNGWNLQEALRLKHDGDAYNEILATTREAVATVGLDWTINFRAQDPGKLSNCYTRMRQRHDHLTQFKNDWACRELVINALQNRRKTESAKLRSVFAQKSPNSAQTSKRRGFNPRSKVTLTYSEGPESTADGS
ncbi:hypothetical protein FS837_011780 [Tulasnella sp. UAMH 9824]|nr:hypothetical protein FS837_011780 [Tulasnella sp. UAMH 9824]